MPPTERFRGQSTTIQPLLDPQPQRLMSLDAYRGFVMLAMVSHGFALPRIARESAYAHDPVWQRLAYQFDHVPWIGCSFWDLIQPSFMFMVGVAMAFSRASRAASGQSYFQMALHAAWRAVALVLLGVFLRSVGQKQTNFTFVDVTSQIGLGYFFLFLLWGRRPVTQFLWAVAILGGYWLAFYLYPVPKEINDAALGIEPGWKHLTGIAAHWDKNTNLAADFDVWFLNLFPRETPFVVNEGGYQTLNFIPSLATMIFGLLTGELLRSGLGHGQKILWMLLAGAAGLAAGLTLDHFGLCPLVKRIWTPSWTMFAAGCTLWMLAGFYLVIEVVRLRSWAFPLVVVGMNSIAIYCMDKLIRGWILGTFRLHLGQEILSGKDVISWLNSHLGVNLPHLRPEFVPLVECVVGLMALWLICYWMYRRKIFLKI
jgi:heparan-alpha-glucosaminide N-acetyltransferase